MDAAELEHALDTLGGAVVAAQLPSGQANTLQAAARDAFTASMRLTGLVAAVVALAIALLGLAHAGFSRTASFSRVALVDLCDDASLVSVRP